MLHWIACHTIVLVLSLFILIAVVFRGPLFGIWPQLEPVVESKSEVNPQAVSSNNRGEAAVTADAEPAKALVGPAGEDQLPVTVESPVQAGSETVSDAGTEEKISVDSEKSVLDELVADEPQFAVTRDQVDKSPEPEKVSGLSAEQAVEEETAISTSPAVEPQPADVVESRMPKNNSDVEEVVQRESAEAIQDKENYQFRPASEEPVDAADEQPDLLQQARKAYWNDEMEKARVLYHAYIDQHPDNPDGYGELGNLLSTMGKLDAAAEMYRMAADMLDQRGEIEQAQQLKEVISSIEVIQNTQE